MSEKSEPQPYSVDHSGSDYQWHAYCHLCPTTSDGGWQSVATAHTLDSVRLTRFANAIVQHTTEVHGGE